MSRDRSAFPWDLDPVRILLTGACGFLVGYAVLSLGANHDQNSAKFASSPGFRLWAFITGLQVAAWATVFQPLWTMLRSYQAEWRRHRGPIVAVYGSVAVLLGFGLWVYRLHVDWPLWLHEVRLSILTAIGALLIGIPALCGLVLARYRVEDIPSDLPLQDTTAVFVETRRDLRGFLFIAGAAVGLATVGTVTLQRAVVPGFFDANQVPSTVGVGYGALLSGLLLILYVPAHLSVADACRRVQDSVFDLRRMPLPTEAEFQDWLERRESLGRLLLLHTRLIQDLQDGLVILAPLLSGLLSLRFVP